MIEQLQRQVQAQIAAFFTFLNSSNQNCAACGRPEPVHNSNCTELWASLKEANNEKKHSSFARSARAGF